MALKSYDEFVNETIMLGQYSYYGQGSLYPIVHKLATEGKTAQQIYLYLTTLGIDEERKRKVISQIFLNESIDFDELETLYEGLYEDDDLDTKEIDKLVKADAGDLAKGIDPSKAKVDPEIDKALDKLKSGDEETMKDKEKEGDSKDKDDSQNDKILALQAAMKDAEKLDKIRKILAETFEMDFSNESNEFISGVFEYHKLDEKLSSAERDRLKPQDFVFPDKRSWPIHDEAHAKTALVWATWPQYTGVKAQIIKAVLKKYPQLKGFGAAK
jgi:hypothetical protein